MALLMIPTIRGHDAIEWQTDDSDSLKKAEKTFYDKLKQGWKAYRENVKGTWEQIKTFLPDEDRILLLPIHKAVAG